MANAGSVPPDRKAADVYYCTKTGVSWRELPAYGEPKNATAGCKHDKKRQLPGRFFVRWPMGSAVRVLISPNENRVCRSLTLGRLIRTSRAN